jgi:hypothetical protein
VNQWETTRPQRNLVDISPNKVYFSNIFIPLPGGKLQNDYISSEEHLKSKITVDILIYIP